MKGSAIGCLLILICLAAPAFGQKGCGFNIVGTWKAATPDGANDRATSVLYRFAPDGTVTVLSGSGSELREIARATYKLDYPDEPDYSNAPQTITFTAITGGGVFAERTTAAEVTGYDDTSFTCVSPNSGPRRWVRVDPNRYFVVLAARLGTFYDRSGPAFPMLIRTDGRETQVEAVGVYSVKGRRAFGPVPPEAYKEFMKEPRHTDSDVYLRLEITSAQYERGLNILRTWEKRVRENALFYSKKGSLDNVVLVKQVTESLAQCGEKIKLYKLNYVYDDDWVSNKYGAPFVPFNYFKELRRLNESLHVRDETFPRQEGSK